MSTEVDDFLEHYGVKGMRWGVRKDDSLTGVSRKTNREAKKDAEEHARAKMFYGEGAGTRRKLINKSVEAKSKRDPSYKKAFDYHSERQDASKHASAARKERSSTDRKTRNKQRSGAIVRRITGEPGTQAAIVAAVAGGAAYLNSPNGRRMMAKNAASISRATKNAQAEFARRQGARRMQNLLNDLTR